MRYADDFLVWMRPWDERVQNWIENSLEGKFPLTINREKTKVVDLKEEKAKVNFLVSASPGSIGTGEAVSADGSLGQSDEEGTGEPA